MDCYDSEETSVTHVIFDVDGTILDTESVYNRAKQKVLSRYGADHLYTRELREKTAGKQAGDVARFILLQMTIFLQHLKYKKKFGRFS